MTKALAYQEEKDLGIRRDDGSLNLKQLKPIHYKVISMHLQGMNNVDISQQVKKTQATISRWLSDPLIKDVLAKHYDAEDARLKALTSKSIDAIEAGLDPKKSSIDTRLKAAKMQLETQNKFDKDAGKKQAETAEDIIARVLENVKNIENVNIQVNNSNDS